MNTEITYKKTPHAVCNTIYGTTGVDVIHAWCFENDDINDRLVKKWISKAQCYVQSGLQELPDYLFKEAYIRKYHVDVWNQKAKNYRIYNKFLTNYELQKYFQEEESNKVAADILINSFE
jgi:hypothetical protein